MRKVMGSGWYHLHWPHESFGISPERDVTAHGGLCDGEWCDLMFWKDPSGCCIRPAWDLGNIVRPAVTLQSEGKTPQLWDTADVWTVMGFRVLLQASGGGGAGSDCFCGDGLSCWRRSDPTLRKWDCMVHPHALWIQMLVLPQKQTDPSAGSLLPLSQKSLYSSILCAEITGFFVCFPNWLCRNGNFLIFILISSSQQSVLYN